MNATRATPETDAELIRRYRAGDSTAFEEIVARYEAPVRGVLYGFLRDPTLVEDVAQETFLRALDKLHKITDPSALRSWLVSIACNGARDELRRRKRQRQVPLDSQEAEVERERGPRPGPLGDAVRSDLRRDLAEALQHVPESSREALVLKIVEGWTYAEIARFQGIPMGTVQIRIHRARLQLRKLLEADGAAASGGAEGVA